MVTQAIIQQHRAQILALAMQHGAHDVRIFGSVARGDTTENSDLDLIVRFDSDRSLLDHGGLLMDLQDLLGVKVDVIDEEGMRPNFRQHVMKEAVAL